MKKPEFTMEKMRNAALALIVVLNLLATVVSFGESYAGLYRWAVEHQITGFWGGVWPLMVDVIVLVGEAALFVAHYDKWKLRHKSWLWFVVLTALGVSVGGNTGHVHSTDFLTHLSAALAPVALMFTTTVGFGIMKRTFMHKPKPVTETPTVLTHVAAPSLSMAAVREQIAAEVASQVSAAQVSRTETREVERPAPQIPDPTEDPGATRVQPGFKVTEKSYTMPKDPRNLGNDLTRIRVRDMYDVDPDITPNAIAKTLGIAWATADKYLKETKEARGLEL